MFCMNCGAQIADGSVFCPKCGASLSAPTASTDQTQVVAPVEPTQAIPAAARTQYVPAAVPTPEPVAQPTSQPTQVMPQPVTTAPPTSGASQPSYAYQSPAPAPKKKSPLPAIIGAVAALAVVGGIGMHFLGGGSEPEPAPSVPEVTTTDTTETETTEPEATEPEATEPEVTAPAASFPDECLDALGNPTFYAMSELTGSDLVAVLEGEGWGWNEEKLWFASSDHNDLFYVSGPNDYEYTYDEIGGLSQYGAGEPVVYITVVDDRDYASASDVIGALAEGSTIDAIEWLNDEQTTGVVAVSCPSTGRSIALISYESNTEMYVVDFFNTEAVAQGVVDEWLGDNYGTSVDEIWETVFGYTPGA